jgi:FkbH-like protein
LPDHNGIVIAANFTADPIAETLHFWIRRLGWADEVVFAPYNQVFQTLLDANGAFASHPEAAHVLLLRADRVGSGQEFADAVRAFGRQLIVAYCPSPAQPPAPADNEIRLDWLQARYPVSDPFDSHAEQLGDVPYTPLFFVALGTAVMRAIHALRARPYKAIALDCDNTLWSGTCGEDGPEGVVIDEAHRKLQTFMRAQHDAGMVLTLASKNNEADVAETFAAHPDMPLRLTDFGAKRIDWNPKPQGLAAMAEELSLGLDSFILVDDSAKEIAEVKAGFPQVLGLELPHQTGRILHFLEHVWAFDHLQITEEDRRRNDSYRQQADHAGMARQTGSLEEFLRELQVEIHIRRMDESQVARVAQLTQRTNQMNTTLIRRTGQEVRQTECWTVDVSDRFGSYGLVGVIFLSEAGDALVVDNLLLSCRALGRGVEQRMLARVHELAAGKGKSRVEIPVVEGPRNQPARDFVNGRHAARHTATGSPSVDPGPTPDRPDVVNYAHIARELSRPLQILDAIRLDKRSRAAERAESQAPRSDLEVRLAAIWAETLRVPDPGVTEDFFDLGGHSLLAVQLLSAVRQEFGVELSMDLVYAGKLTIAGMAAAVELAQADPEEMARLMAEIDGLSEEELQALLAEE